MTTQVLHQEERSKALSIPANADILIKIALYLSILSCIVLIAFKG